MKQLFLLSTLGCALAAGSAQAQVSYNSPNRGSYGGGFIEFLVTGQGQTRQGQQAQRSQGWQSQAGQYQAGIDPFAEPRRQRYAGLPAEQDVTRISRSIDPVYQRQMVAYQGREAPGTIVVDTGSRFLYHVQGGGQAMRYGIGVGRPGFEWAGMKTVTRKAEWPGWTPPPEMLKRRPDLPRHMVGGPANPLGARALYLGSSLYRIHGTNEPWTIGQDVSSGCIRMMNEDVIDLYGKVRVGTVVKVI